MKISLFGYGKVMQSLARTLAPCEIFDDKFKEISTDSLNNLLKPSHLFNAQDSDLEIISPGIPPDSKLAKSARNLISEYDFFYKNFEIPFSVWISGTNGKTTTTQMTEFILEDYGAKSGGNIGIPLNEMDRSAKMWILETSSFVLFYTKIAAPNIYALLPITPDHLTWHGNMENYIRAKLKPLTMMNSESSAIIPLAFKDSSEAKNFKGKIYFYESARDLGKIFGFDISQIRFKGAFLLDSALSLSISKIASNRALIDKINRFIIGQHRIEEFRDAKGRLFVDDSKATNIDASLAALEIYKDKKIYLILGGDNKGVSLEPLIEKLRKFDVNIFAIGACKEHISEICARFSVNCEVSGDLKSAVLKIGEFLKDDEVCLLSPACASLDQFNSYAQRGEFFKLYAMNLV